MIALRSQTKWGRRFLEALVCSTLSALFLAACEFDPAGVGPINPPDDASLQDVAVSPDGDHDGGADGGLDGSSDGGEDGGGAVCGDGVIEGGEECDGSNLGGATCDSMPQFQSGVLICAPDCTFDTSGCVGCGDGVVEAQEACDGTNLAGQTCESLGHDGGELACTSGCQLDESGCTDCGDSDVEGAEECDGSNLGGQTCASLGYDAGTLACTDTCTFDESACHTCGDTHCHAAEEGGQCIVDCSQDLFQEDFEGSWPGGWSTGDDDDGDGTDTWGVSGNRDYSGGHSLWCADDRDELLGGYANNMDSWAIHAFDLSGYAGESLTLELWLWCDVDHSDDYFTVILSSDGGATWSDIGGMGDTSGWELVEIDISSYGGEADFMFGLFFHSNGTWSISEGAYVDDLRIYRWW